MWFCLDYIHSEKWMLDRIRFDVCSGFDDSYCDLHNKCKTNVDDMFEHKPEMTCGSPRTTTPPSWPSPWTPPRLRTPPPISMSSSPSPPGSSSTDNTSWCPLFRPAPAQQLRGRQANVQKKSCCWPIKSWPSLKCAHNCCHLNHCFVIQIGFFNTYIPMFPV